MMSLAAVGLAPALAGGAAIGSFLTVVVSRLPALVLGSEDGRVRISRLVPALSWPGSHCHSCQAPVRWRENIPVLSYLLLRGRCRRCQADFGVKYFLLELGGAAAGLACAYWFGWSLQGALCFLLLIMLLALSAIDLETMLLPDVLVLPLLPAGLLFQALYGDGILAAVVGGATAFTAMWAIGAAYKQARGQEGLGGGDVKLAGALGTWIGIAHVLIFLTSAFGVALMVMGPFLLVSRAKAAKPLPFGPFLALSASILVLCPLVGATFDRLIGG